MPKCERCHSAVTRRHRCHICRRLCCSYCLEWPGGGMGRDGVRWCDSYGSRTNKDCQDIADANGAK